ncbi:hypothetical protein KC19_11G033700 [Ceratodon purpureus]|uniref:Cytochrome P450 n=1 Tax=Ceratodon purpureus TaxID=3225 RepID=A0A8T0GCW6_CERPU|nr:hypothetical protein KC19_11G033700 [Ceratodon purpureus]
MGLQLHMKVLLTVLYSNLINCRDERTHLIHLTALGLTRALRLTNSSSLPPRLCFWSTSRDLAVAETPPAMASPSLHPGAATTALRGTRTRVASLTSSIGHAHLHSQSKFAVRITTPERSLGRLQVRCSSDDEERRVDKTGAGKSWVSPDWLTSIVRLGKGPDTSGIPVADAKLEDVKDLLGGALFLPLFKWMIESGPVYRLAAGPRNFVIVGDPAVAKHVLKGYGTKYSKGLVAEVSEFLFGDGFAIAEDQLWTARRRAVVPSLHKKYLSTMVDRVFCRCSDTLVAKLEKAMESGTAVNMEAQFSQLTLDIIGLSVFNYEFDALKTDSPVIEAVYTALKETESRSTDILPYWQIPLLCKIVPRQQKAAKAVQIIRETVEKLVAQCKEMVEAEKETLQGEEYVNESDPSVLRFLLASREENPSALAKVQEELDRVLGGRKPQFADMKELKYLTRCINESMRIYPHPPVCDLHR